MIITFVDDTDIYSAGIDSEKDMQKIMKTYTDLHEATGGLIQKDKINEHNKRTLYIESRYNSLGPKAHRMPDPTPSFRAISIASLTMDHRS